MCVLSSTLIASGLSSLGFAGAAASATAVGATTIAANAILGAAINAGIGAASGQRGGELWRSAGIGGLTAGVLSGAGLAVNGVKTAATATTADAATTATTAGATSSSTSALVQQAEAQARQSFLRENITRAGFDAIEGAFGMYSSYQGAEELKAEAKYNQLRASQVQDAAGLEKMDAARKAHSVAAQQKTAAAANGIMLESRATSAPTYFEQDVAAELAFDQERIDYNANMEALGFSTMAANQLKSAKNMRRAGNLRLASGLIKSGLGAWSRSADFNATITKNLLTQA